MKFGWQKNEGGASRPYAGAPAGRATPCQAPPTMRTDSALFRQWYRTVRALPEARHGFVACEEINRTKSRQAQGPRTDVTPSTIPYRRLGPGAVTPFRGMQPLPLCRRHIRGTSQRAQTKDSL